jgi:fatty acid-binding protein DegV
MDLTNKQMQHLSKEMSGMIENNRQNAYLKQAGSYLLDSKDMQQQQGKCNGSSGVQLQ